MLIHKDEMQKNPIKYLFKKEKSQTPLRNLGFL